jgi:hypothetical protein
MFVEELEHRPPRATVGCGVEREARDGELVATDPARQ